MSSGAQAQTGSLRVAIGPTPDVTIIGAGIIGVFTALLAQERGLSVMVVDRHPPGEMTSFGNAGVISPWSCVPQCMPGVWKNVPRWLFDPDGPVKVRWRDIASVLPWAVAFLRNGHPAKVAQISEAMDQLVRDNVEGYRRQLAGTGKEHLIADSYYVNVLRGVPPRDLSDLGWQLRLERGAPLEIISAADLRDLEPALSHDYTGAVLIKGQARARAPGELCKVLAEKAARQGAQFVQADIKEIRRQDGAPPVLMTTSGPIAVNKLVLCGGIWSKALLEPFGIKVPLMAERGYHVEFSEPNVVLHNSIQDVGSKIVTSSMLGGVRTAGTAEFASVDAPANMQRARALIGLTKRMLPGLQTEPHSEWMGIRPSFPDNVPAIGAIDDRRDIFVAFGHSHYGLGMAPATGRIVVDQVLGVPTNAALALVNPLRFAR